MGFIRHPKDFFAGVLFVAVGIAAIVIAANYPLGTAARMGPGYFPRILGILLILLGCALALRALRLQGSRSAGMALATRSSSSAASCCSARSSTLSAWRFRRSS